MLKIIKVNYNSSGRRKKFHSKDNNIIYNLCHNFMTLDDIDFDNLI